MNTRFTLLLLAIVIILLAIRCSTVPDSLNLENTSSNLTGKYAAKIIGTQLHLNLSLENQEHDKVLERSDAIDISKGYRLRMDSRLKGIALDIMGKTTKIDTKKSIMAIQELIDDYGSSHKPEDMSTEEVQGLFYYLTVFKMIHRYNEELTTNKLAQLKCTTYNGYIVGLSPFHAKEDIMINKAHFTKYLSGKPTRLSVPEANAIIEVLKETSAKEITLKDLETRIDLVLIEKSKTLKTAWLEGGDCGCCGNYEGFCWYSSNTCYIHDYLCQTCDPVWFCFRGCKSTPCT